MLVLYKIHRDEYETWIRGLGKKKKKKKVYKTVLGSHRPM